MHKKAFVPILIVIVGFHHYVEFTNDPDKELSYYDITCYFEYLVYFVTDSSEIIFISGQLSKTD